MPMTIRQAVVVDGLEPQQKKRLSHQKRDCSPRFTLTNFSENALLSTPRTECPKCTSEVSGGFATSKSERSRIIPVVAVSVVVTAIIAVWFGLADPLERLGVVFLANGTDLDYDGIAALLVSVIGSYQLRRPCQ